MQGASAKLNKVLESTYTSSLSGASHFSGKTDTVWQKALTPPMHPNGDEPEEQARVCSSRHGEAMIAHQLYAHRPIFVHTVFGLRQAPSGGPCQSWACRLHALPKP